MKLRTIEYGLAGLVLAVLAIMPSLEVIVRLVFRTGLPGLSQYGTHAVLWAACFGGIVASREKRHLAISLGTHRLPRPWSAASDALASASNASICLALAVAALAYLLTGFDPYIGVGIIPIRTALLPLPLAFAIMSTRLVGQNTRAARIGRLVGLAAGLALSLSSLADISHYLPIDLSPLLFEGASAVSRAVPGTLSLLVLAAAALCGAPLFVVLGGSALLLFIAAGGVASVVVNEAYTLLVGHNIAAIPLFTLAGFVLSQSKAGERLLRLFRALIGWLPGGAALVAILVCTFFTTFTGATGVTILALGALLLFTLEKGGYPRPLATGLLTASGSIGLLFPPSLPIILYGVVAQINIKHLFIAGIVPGLLMVGALSALALGAAGKYRIARQPFSPAEAVAALREAWSELLLPVFILVGYFGGVTTLVETGAAAVVYAVAVQVFVRRDLRVRDLLTVSAAAAPIVGGVLLVLAMSRGLAYYIIDMDIPTALAAWVGSAIGSPLLFLLLLNLTLLLAGCFLDIFSAIMVVLPLIIPLGELFGIDPIHLGMIFLTNLSVGYLTPPVGLNLFLASYRFDVPLLRLYRSVFPFFLVLLAVVLAVTYVPFFSTGLLDLFGLRGASG